MDQEEQPIENQVINTPDVEKPIVRTYHFPNEAVSIDATSIEEATKKLEDLNNTKK